MFGIYEAQAHGKPEGTIVRMTCYTAEFTGYPQAGNEIAEIDFFQYAQVDKTSPANHLIFADLYKKGLID